MMIKTSQMCLKAGFNKSQELLSDMFTDDDLLSFLRFYNTTVPLSATSTGENNGLTMQQLVDKFKLSTKSWEVIGEWQNDKFKILRIL